MLNRAEMIALTVTALSQAGSLLYWQYPGISTALTVVLLAMHGATFAFLVSMVFEFSRPWADWLCYGVRSTGQQNGPSGLPDDKKPLAPATVIPVDTEIFEDSKKSAVAMREQESDGWD